MDAYYIDSSLSLRKTWKNQELLQFSEITIAYLNAME